MEAGPQQPRGEAREYLREYRVEAFNYASDSDNKIHDDEVARNFGFSGGLVPGVAVYAYMTRPVVDELGRDWLERGSAEARFVAPVYDGDRVSAHAVHRAESELALELRDSGERLCATGTASWNRAGGPDAATFAVAELPPLEDRPAVSLEELAAGRVMGSLVVGTVDRELRESLVERYRDPHPLYLGAAGHLHPAFVPDQANQILSRNVKLGPWIHTASKIAHFAQAEDGELLEMRGRVAASYPRKGHEFIELDLVLLGEDDRVLATILHTAIIRPRRRDQDSPGA